MLRVADLRSTGECAAALATIRPGGCKTGASDGSVSRAGRPFIAYSRMVPGRAGTVPLRSEDPVMAEPMADFSFDAEAVVGPLVKFS
jgi:hypothetical protein